MWRKPAPPPNAHGEASDLHPANIAGLAQLRKRVGRGRAGALQRLNLRFSRLLRLALNHLEREGQGDNNLPSSTVPLRRVAAAEAGIRAGLVSLTPFPWKKSYASACCSSQGALRTASRTALQLVQRRHSPQQSSAGASRIEAVPPRAAHASVPCRQGITHPAK